MQDDVDFYAIADVPGTDVTNYFQHGSNLAACSDTGNPAASQFKAVTFDVCSSNNGYSGCKLGPLSPATFKKLDIENTTRMVGYDWEQLAGTNLTHFFVLDGNVLNMGPYITANPHPISGDELDTVIRSILGSSFAEGGRDGTKQFFRKPELRAAMNCLVQKYTAGHIDKQTPGCVVASIVLFFALAVVLSIVLARFFMAIIFAWFLSWKMSRTPAPIGRYSGQRQPHKGGNAMEMSDIKQPIKRVDSGASMVSTTSAFVAEVGNDLFTVLLITCYSEGLDGIRDTVESLSRTQYPDHRKLLFLIADGMITGSGESMTTPDICLSLITFDKPEFKTPEPMSYIAVADGAKQYNRAKVYAGHYG